MVTAQWLAPEGNWPALEKQSSDNLEAIISAIMACHRAWQSVRDTAKEQPDAPVPLGRYVQELSALGEALCSVKEQPDAPVPLGRYVQELSALGEALCSVAHKLSCNNPVCSNVLGPSELQLLRSDEVRHCQQPLVAFQIHQNLDSRGS